MGGGDRGRTLGQVLWEVERARFVGRKRERAQLDAALSGVQNAPSRHVWLQGAEGVGKSALLRVLVHQARYRSLPVLHIEGAARPNRVALALQELAYDLRHSLGVPVLATPPSLASGIQMAGWPWNRPLLVAVDDADQLMDAEAAVLANVLRPLDVGVCAVWAARQQRPGLWREALPAGVAAERRTLSGLEPCHAQRLVERDGVRLDAAVVHAASAGNPRMLARAASRLEEPDAPRAAWDREAAVVSLLVEQWLHPGSRRLAWRAGVGQAGTMDTVVAAAAVLGPCDRHSLSQILGGAQVRAHWSRLERLPFVVRGAGGHHLDLAVAEHLGGEVRRWRPWAVRHWRLRAVGIGRGGDPAVAWRESVVQAARWWPPLPDAVGDVSVPSAAQAPTRLASSAAGPWQGSGGLVVAMTDVGVVVRPAGRSCAACARRVALADGARSALDGHALVGPALRAYGDGARDADALQFCLSPRDPERAGGLPCGFIGRGSADLAGLRRVVWASQADVAPAAERLGFRSLGRDGGAALYDLDLPVAGRREGHRLAGRLASTPPSESQVAALRAALAAMDDPPRLLATAVGAYGVEAFQLRGAIEIRRWLQDMLELTAADGSLPPVDASLLRASMEDGALEAVPTAVRLYRTRRASARFAALLFA